MPEALEDQRIRFPDRAVGAPRVWVEPTARRVRAVFGGVALVDSTGALLLFETEHLPVYYVPIADVRMDLLTATGRRTHCPLKGDASYWTVTVGDRVAAGPGCCSRPGCHPLLHPQGRRAYGPAGTDGHRHPVPLQGQGVLLVGRVRDAVVEDIAWSYPFPIPECPKIEQLVAFYNERVEALYVDGELQPVPQTPWSKRPR